MKDNHAQSGLILTNNGHEYQLLGDEKNLYFVRTDLPGQEDRPRRVQDVSALTHEDLSRVMPKSQIRHVRCVSERDSVQIEIVHGNSVSRFTAAEDVTKAEIRAVFSGVKIRFASQGSSVSVDRNELILLGVCLLNCVLRVLLADTAIGPWLILIWALVPLCWVAMCAVKKPEAGRSRFTIGAGALATMFACAFLWSSATGELDSWSGLYLPSIVGAAVTTAVYLILRRKWDALAIAVAVVSLLFYAPGAALALNAVLPAREVTTIEATVLQLTTSYSDGDWDYTAVIEYYDVQFSYQIDQSVYAELEEDGTVYVVSTVGALGISYTELQAETAEESEDAEEEETEEEADEEADEEEEESADEAAA